MPAAESVGEITSRGLPSLLSTSCATIPVGNGGVGEEGFAVNSTGLTCHLRGVCTCTSAVRILGGVGAGTPTLLTSPACSHSSLVALGPNNCCFLLPDNWVRSAATILYVLCTTGEPTGLPAVTVLPEPLEFVLLVKLTIHRFSGRPLNVRIAKEATPGSGNVTKPKFSDPGSLMSSFAQRLSSSTSGIVQ